MLFPSVFYGLGQKCYKGILIRSVGGRVGDDKRERHQQHKVNIKLKLQSSDL